MKVLYHILIVVWQTKPVKLPKCPSFTEYYEIEEFNNDKCAHWPDDTEEDDIDDGIGRWSDDDEEEDIDDGIGRWSDDDEVETQTPNKWPPCTEPPQPEYYSPWSKAKFNFPGDHLHSILKSNTSLESIHNNYNSKKLKKKVSFNSLDLKSETNNNKDTGEFNIEELYRPLYYACYTAETIWSVSTTLVAFQIITTIRVAKVAKHVASLL